MNLASGMRRWTLLPLLALALYVAPRVVSMLVFLTIAFIVYLALAAVQSLFEMSRVVSSTLLSAAASAFYHGRYHQTHLLLAGFRGDAVRRIPASAYLHTTYGLDRSLCDELGTLINILAGDFITSWYKHLTTDDVFPTTVKLLLCDLLGGLCVRIKRHLDLHGCLSLVTEVLQVVQLHLAWFRELYVALADEHPHIFGDDSHASLDLRRRLLLDCVATNHPKLHPGCLPNGGGGYLKHISKQMLVLLRPDFDDKNTSSLMTFPSLAWHFTSEIVANCVLTPLLAYCNPIYLNPIVASALEPLQAKEIDLEAKRPLASYTASHIAKSAAMIDDATLVNHLVSLMNEMEMTTPEPLIPISPLQQFNLPSTTTMATTTTPKAKMSKHKKTLSLLDVSKMKARFRRRLHSNTSERSDTELSKSDCEPSVGHDLITQLDHAVDLFLNLNARTDGGGASGRSRELHGLISALEEVLLFGLKTQTGDEANSSSSSYWSYINQRRAQAAFWNDRLEWIHSLPSPRISDGHFSPRGVQWLLLALEEGELWEFFTAMTLDMDMTQVYYEPYAILRERELCVLLLASLFRLNGLRAALPLQALGHDRMDNGASHLDPSNPFAVSTVVEEAWESERYLPLQGWTKSSDKRKRSDERLPSTEWFWETPWTLEECPEDSAVDEKSQETDHRGWQYSKTSKEVGFHSKESMLDCIRRRKWRRVRKTLPLLLAPEEDPPTSAAASNNQEKPVKVQEVAACFRCRRGLESSSASHACPTCLKAVCFSCSNHCVEVANVKQRVCSTCYEQHAAALRLQLSVRVARVDPTSQDTFLLQVVTADGHKWSGVKTWADIEALNIALMEQPPEFVDPGEWRRMSPYFLRPLGASEDHVNRFLDELLKCHQLSQTHAVQTFLLDVATPPEAPAETKEMKVPSPQTTRQGQILLQKLEIQAFKMMDELFELDEMNRLRRRLLSVTRTFIRVSLNATCHRIVEAQFVELTHPKKIAAVLCDVRTMAIPPDGIYYRDEPPPSAFQIHEGMRACRSALLRCCPPAFVSLLGDTATHNGCLKIFEFLQHEVLVKNLALSLLDMLLQRIFPEMPPWTQPKKAALGKSRGGS
ncbi:unnamed protein product [Aphanomyces euteiches]|uniref:RUN domain-containing protein n=2 Tax=Aphanomyces euteiches TaxID=100861 RepID=A0A6G0WWF6_9STRA|nr:hypothetical protein Ae201684_010851 [Aphanomyces euteiches]KAH9061424.1 hypothetical protein Ae201684P_020760 [Aphanomyces euteiches]